MKVNLTYQRNDLQYYLKVVDAVTIETGGVQYNITELVPKIEDFPNLPALPYGVTWVDVDSEHGYYINACIPYAYGEEPQPDYSIITEGPELIFDTRS